LPGFRDAIADHRQIRVVHAFPPRGKASNQIALFLAT
jgi:hypothetical protein